MFKLSTMPHAKSVIRITKFLRFPRSRTRNFTRSLILGVFLGGDKQLLAAGTGKFFMITRTSHRIDELMVGAL